MKKIKKYIFEFVGFTIFYFISASFFGADSYILCFVLGVIGIIIGRFFYKLNSLFIGNVISHEIIKENNGILEIIFDIEADYKMKPIILTGSYHALSMIETSDLFVLLYNDLTDYHFKQIKQNGSTKYIAKLKNENIEIELKFKSP